jgi:hypothetical protein
VTKHDHVEFCVVVVSAGCTCTEESEEISMFWKLWEVPTGPESSTEKRLVLEGSREDVLEQYEEDRQDEGGGGDALIVVDDNGNTVYACS